MLSGSVELALQAREYLDMTIANVLKKRRNPPMKR